MGWIKGERRAGPRELLSSQEFVVLDSEITSLRVPIGFVEVPIAEPDGTPLKIYTRLTDLQGLPVGCGRGFAYLGPEASSDFSLA